MISLMNPRAFTALVTPFDSNGEIDYPAVARLLAWHEANGMDGVVVAGTNGEGPSLSAIEKRDLTKFAVQNRGKLSIISGLGTPSLTEAIWLSEQAQKAGADAALVLPPYYYSAPSEGILAWFEKLLEKTELPVILYNFPQTTKILLDPPLVRRLFEHTNVLGIKDSSGDEELLCSYLELAKAAEKKVFVGDERLILKCLQNGGSGTISGLANSFPLLVSRQVRERTDVLQTIIDEAFKAIKKHPQPAVHKAVLDFKGLPGGNVRPPLVPLDKNAREEVKDFVSRFGF
ncbi:MAG TPA: 4-hydroxy-tetrahydrodipicolinate synthase [Fimbriimonadales bacterium]|nr:4-hydroxy-tetrahydrodipicolinate synthase [Fimbriimonadales bacterium]